MQIQFSTVNFTPNQKKTYSTPQKSVQYSNKGYAPIAYRDFDISFEARLFRSPENFYEQDFNKKHMPLSLQKYIYEGDNSDFKRTIPPAQAMKEVFGEIENAKTLEDVKEMFPNEPLFKDLTSIPNKNSREGLLGVINLFKNDPDYVANNRTLFKNGKDDLGMYILKKIYVEGKTLKEINKDFAKDVSTYYSGFDISYKDYAAFGIKFPERPFWKSFIATREDFPYVYIPRNVDSKSTSSSDVTSMNRQTSTVQHKKREPMSYVQRKKMSEIMINYHANMTPEQKSEWYKKLIAGMENSVVHNYFGEIVTIAQDKVGHADKMATFFEKMYGDPDYLQNVKNSDDREKALTKFWKAHQQHKRDYSKAMSEVIEQFDKAYNNNGENVEFKELLLLADSISLKNEENRKLRAQARLENQKQNSVLTEDEVNDVPTPEESNELNTKDSYQKYLEENAEKFGADIYRIKLSNGKEFAFVANLNEFLTQRIDKDVEFMPTSYKNIYKKFVESHPEVDEQLMLSLFYNNNSNEISHLLVANCGEMLNENDVDAIKKELEDKLYSQQEIEDVFNNIYADFEKENAKLVRITQQALAELLFSMEAPENNTLTHLADNQFKTFQEKYDLDSADLAYVKDKLYKDVIDSIVLDFNYMHSPKLLLHKPEFLANSIKLHSESTTLTPQQQRFLDDKVNEYRRPLTDSEVKKISLAIVEKMISFDFEKNMPEEKEKRIKALCVAMIEVTKKNPRARKVLRELVERKYVNSDASDLRCIIKSDVKPELIDAKIFKLFFEMLEKDANIIKLIASSDTEIIDKYVKHQSPELYSILIDIRNIIDIQTNKDELFDFRKLYN